MWRSRFVLALTFVAISCSNSSNTTTVGDAGVVDAGDAAVCQGACGRDGGADAGNFVDSQAGTDAAADPSVIGTATNAPEDLCIDATYLYWSENHQRILRMPLAGGMMTPIVPAPASSGGQIWHFAIDSTGVYWTDQGGGLQKAGGVYAAPIDGSGAPVLLTHATGPLNLSVDNGYVYFTFQNGIARVRTTGGNQTILVQGTDVETPIFAFGGFVYLAYPVNSTNTEQVYRVPVSPSTGPADAGGAGDGGVADGGPPDGGDGGGPPLVGEGGILEQFSVNGRFSTLYLGTRADLGNIYWSVFDELHYRNSDGSAQVDLGQVSDLLQPTNGGSIDLLVPYNGDVYWRSDQTQLWKFVAGGSPRQPLASSSNVILGVAVNDTYVYFADGVRIRRLPR
jgi:hypothetical protein